MLKRVVFLVFSLWALVDGFLTARDMPTPSLKVIGFFGSFLLSALFLAIVALTWNWITSWLRHHLAIMRLGHRVRRTGTPAGFADTYASGLVEIIETLSASIVLFGGRRTTARAPETERTIFETHFEMEQSGFQPIEKDIAILVAAGIEDARRADSELLCSAFRAASGFLCLYSQNRAHRYMKGANAKEFTGNLALSLCQRLAGRFGFNNEPRQTAGQIDEVLPQLCCDRFLNTDALGHDDAVGRLLKYSSLPSSREIQYGFVVGSMAQQLGCAWAVLRAVEAIDDSIKRCAEDMRW